MSDEDKIGIEVLATEDKPNRWLAIQKMVEYAEKTFCRTTFFVMDKDYKCIDIRWIKHDTLDVFNQEFLAIGIINEKELVRYKLFKEIFTDDGVEIWYLNLGDLIEMLNDAIERRDRMIEYLEKGVKK